MPTVALDIEYPAWSAPLLEPARYKGAKGGRSRGGSHFFAGLVVEHLLCDPEAHIVCIREVQRTLRYSAKSLIESKIREHGLQDYFQILVPEIRSRVGNGVIIFEGMQDHTADSIKSLEGFERAWVEEAQSLSKRSIDLLLPTIRMPGSELWFSWNPREPDDPIETLFRALAGETYPEASGFSVGESHAVVHATYKENPFIEPDGVVHREAERMRALDPDAYDHIWDGGYDIKSDAKVLAGKYVVEEFDVPHREWGGPYHGADHGFAMDPRVLVRCWIGPHPKWGENCLYVEHESYHVKLGISATAAQWAKDVPGFARYVVRAESAEPGTNDYLQKNGVPLLEGVKKWPGSVKDGIAHLHSYDKIIVHPRCVHTAEECRLYSYKVDKRTGDILPDIEDKFDHTIDSIRYALAPLTLRGAQQVPAGLITDLSHAQRPAWAIE